MDNRWPLKLLASAAVFFATLIGVAVVSAQPVRIAVGAASVASLPTWVAHDGGYFARESVPAQPAHCPQLRWGHQNLRCRCRCRCRCRTQQKPSNGAMSSARSRRFLGGS